MHRTQRFVFAAIAVLVTSVGACIHVTPFVLLPAPMINLAVRDQSTATLDAGEAIQIAERANKILREGSGADTGCDVGLNVSSYGHLNIDAPKIIDSEEAFKSLFADVTPLNGFPPTSSVRHVRVVEELRWCGSDETNLAGCAIGLNIAVIRLGKALERVLWAHEVGHTKGLQHRDGQYDWLAIMFPSIEDQHFELTSDECTLYRQ